MKKILFLGGIQAGGAEHQMAILAGLLKKKGYDVTFLTIEGRNFFQSYLEDHDVKLVFLKHNRIISFLKLNTPYIVKQVRRVMKQGMYDTVVSFLGFWNYVNCRLAYDKNTMHRAITGIRNNRDEVFLSWRDRYYTRFERYAYKKVSNSESAKIKFGHYYPEIAEKLITIYNVVDIPSITSTYTPRKEGQIHIIVPASYRTVKNPMRLLEAVRAIMPEDRNNLIIDWYGSIKGGKELHKQMQDYVHTYDLDKIIKLHDATNDIANRIFEADVVGLFSTSEGLPNAICEGMMLGKPIVMTRVSDYNYLVNDENGFLCDANDTNSIALALQAVSKMTEVELQEKGIKSKEKAMSLFSEEIVIKQWEQII